jgi:hypothetical protein
VQLRIGCAFKVAVIPNLINELLLEEVAESKLRPANSKWGESVLRLKLGTLRLSRSVLMVFGVSA